MKFSEMLDDLIAHYTQTTVANEIGVDSAKLSRFRSEKEGLSIKQIEKLMQLSKSEIISAEQCDGMATTIFTMAELWRQERRKLEMKK